MNEQVDDILSRIELKLEKGKLIIEHERFALERERFKGAKVNGNGESGVSLSVVQQE
jgi:hypothetical protein